MNNQQEITKAIIGGFDLMLTQRDKNRKHKYTPRNTRKETTQQ